LTNQDSKSGQITHILSVDVEDYFQVEAFAGSVSRGSWKQWPSRVAANTQRVLDLFDEYNAKATFFFVGWVPSSFRSWCVRSNPADMSLHATAIGIGPSTAFRPMSSARTLDRQKE